MSRLPLAVGAAALALLSTSCVRSTGNSTVGAPSAAPTTPVTTSATPSPTPSATTAPTTTAPTTAAPTATPTASPTHPPTTYDVKGLQALLTAQKYYVGAIDGQPGAAFRNAVAAFQKVNGLYGDGVVGPKTLKAVQHPVTPHLKESGGGTRVEVDLSKQVLYVAKAGVIERVLPVSSGSGNHYLTKSGHRATALTPIGHYAVQRRIIGVRKADLGTLYDPEYYYKGWAIHGSNSVPGYPASHGCIRVPRADGTWLLDQIGVGTKVYVYGGTHVFTAGSSAAGTSDPGGDTGTTTPPARPAPRPTPSPKPRPKPSPKPSATPRPSATPKATPSR